MKLIVAFCGSTNVPENTSCWSTWFFSLNVRHDTWLWSNAKMIQCAWRPDSTGSLVCEFHPWICVGKGLWPAIPPDLYSHNFYLWEALKQMVYHKNLPHLMCAGEYPSINCSYSREHTLRNAWMLEEDFFSFSWRWMSLSFTCIILYKN
jgi:hypothetical protein